MQGTKFKLWRGGLKEQGCMKAGSLHTACGLPQLAHRICPERVILSIVNLIHSKNLRSSLLAHIMAASVCVCGIESVDIIPIMIADPKAALVHVYQRVTPRTSLHQNSPFCFKTSTPSVPLVSCYLNVDPSIIRLSRQQRRFGRVAPWRKCIGRPKIPGPS